MHLQAEELAKAVQHKRRAAEAGHTLMKSRSSGKRDSKVGLLVLLLVLIFRVSRPAVTSASVLLCTHVTHVTCAHVICAGASAAAAARKTGREPEQPWCVIDLTLDSSFIIRSRRFKTCMLDIQANSSQIPH